MTVIRSVSDAVEPAGKYCSGARRCNGFLRRPEVLETVYSVEEDGDADRVDDEADEEDNNDEADPGNAAAGAPTTTTAASNAARNDRTDGKPRLRDLYGSFERLAQHETELQERERCSGLGSQQPAPATLPQRTRDESQQAQVSSPGAFFIFPRLFVHFHLTTSAASLDRSNLLIRMLQKMGAIV